MYPPAKPTIQIDDFEKIDIRVGTITSAENVPGSEKLLKLAVDFGDLGTRQILTGMAKWYKPEELVGMQTTFVINLAPRQMMGVESQGMIFALGLTNDTKPTFLAPKTPVSNGEGAR
jgi:methionyl-tRNA synthetase